MSSKRRHTEADQDTKKVRTDLEQQVYSSSDEWPVYNHPEGGIVKMTPWGSLRQYVNPLNGQMMTKFEDKNFQDHTFNQNAEQLSLYVPSTPQSMCPTSSDSPSPAEHLKLSPSHEVEHYVMDGYQQQQQQQQQLYQYPQQFPQEPVHQKGQGREFQTEHENYFGMGNSEEEADYDNEDHMMS